MKYIFNFSLNADFLLHTHLDKPINNFQVCSEYKAEFSEKDYISEQIWYLLYISPQIRHWKKCIIHIPSDRTYLNMEGHHCDAMKLCKTETVQSVLNWQMDNANSEE